MFTLVLIETYFIDIWEKKMVAILLKCPKDGHGRLFENKKIQYEILQNK